MNLIIVTSKGDIKTEATRACVKALGIPDPVIVGIKTDSGVGDQPFGEETLLGAHQRIDDAKIILDHIRKGTLPENNPKLQDRINRARARLAEAGITPEQLGSLHSIFSMENGLIKQADGTGYNNRCAVVIETGGKRYEGYDAGLPLSASYDRFVEEAWRRKQAARSGDKTVTECTAAALIGQELGWTPEEARDPHRLLTGKPRAEYLAEAAIEVGKKAFPALTGFRALVSNLVQKTQNQSALSIR